MKQAAGIIEVYGVTTAFVAADAACKAGNVTIQSIDKNKPAGGDNMPVPLIMCIKIRGPVSDVRAGVEAAVKVAEKLSGVVSSLVIPAPAEGTEKMLNLSAI